MTAERSARERRIRESAAEEERSRLARDLHDSIKQQLFTIEVSAAAAEERWEGDPEGARQALGDARTSARHALTEMAALLRQLRPRPLDNAGLVEALREQADALGCRTGAEVVCRLGELPDEAALALEQREDLFRIAQEAFANVGRHARAGRVTVDLGQRLLRGRHWLVLEIADDGQGFDAAEVRHRGMGLQNIEQRVRRLGGELRIDAAPGEGTRVRVRVPAARPEDEETAAERHEAALRLRLWTSTAVLSAALFLLGMLLRRAPDGADPGAIPSEASLLLVLGAGAVAVFGHAVRRAAALDPGGWSPGGTAALRLRSLVHASAAWVAGFAVCWLPWYAGPGWDLRRWAVLGVAFAALVLFADQVQRLLAVEGRLRARLARGALEREIEREGWGRLPLAAAAVVAAVGVTAIHPAPGPALFLLLTAAAAAGSLLRTAALVRARTEGPP